MAASVRVDPRKLADLLRSPAGPVAKELIRRGERVKERAKGYVGKDTRKLEQSIVKRFVTSGDGIAVTVGSALPYAKLHHDDTEPHEIVPVKAKVLVFKIKGGGLVFATHVNHPGTTGTKYLERAAKDEGLKFQRL